jgi:hypothetical protein
MAKRNPAIHAASALLTEFFLLHVEVKFVPVFDAFDRGTIQRQLS